MITIDFTDKPMYGPVTVEIPETGVLEPIDSFVAVHTNTMRVVTEFLRANDAIGQASEMNMDYRTNLRSHEGSLTCIAGHPAIGITLRPPHYSCAVEELLLIWLEQRTEWIGIVRTEWFQGLDWENSVTCYGPYAIDELHATKILQAYGIESGLLGAAMAIRTDPSRLKQMQADRQT